MARADADSDSGLRGYVLFRGANKGHTRKSWQIVCRLADTVRRECSKLGKTRIITDASCGMVRNTGFSVEFEAAWVYLELLSIHF